MSSFRRIIPRKVFPNGTRPVAITAREFLEIEVDRIDLRPDYQRDISWSAKKMCYLISSVMHGDCIFGFLLYKLTAKDKKRNPHDIYECIDGQHRIFSMAHYYHSKPVELPGKKAFMITYIYKYPDGSIEHVFYQKNEHTENWIRKNKSLRFDYMTPEEQEVFNEYELHVTRIRDPLTDAERRDMFVRLQQNTPVRGSDLLKNKTHVPAIYLTSVEMSGENDKRLIESNCSTKAIKYWQNWMIRSYLMCCPPPEKSVSDMFLLTDTDIKNHIDDEHPYLKTTETTCLKFKECWARFTSFVRSLPGVKFSAIQWFALFSHLCRADTDREEILRAHMATWVKDHAEQHGVWEKQKGVTVEPFVRAKYFEDNLKELEEIKTAPAPIIIAPKVSKKLRKQLYLNKFGSIDAVGSCYCCADKICFKDRYHAGHIKARACSGETTLENLRPVCETCNKRMGTLDMDDFKAKHFPHL